MPAFLSDSIVRGLSGDFQKTPLSQTTVVGATLSLPRVPAKVPSLNRQRPLSPGGPEPEKPLGPSLPSQNLPELLWPGPRVRINSPPANRRSLARFLLPVSKT